MGFLPWDSWLPDMPGGPRPARSAPRSTIRALPPDADRKAAPAPRVRWPRQPPAADSTRPSPCRSPAAPPAFHRTGRVPACPTAVQPPAPARAALQAIAYKRSSRHKARVFSQLQALRIVFACKHTARRITGLDFACNNMQANAALEGSASAKSRENRAFTPEASPFPTVPQDIRSCVYLIADSHENAIFVDLDQVLSIIACNCMQYMTNAGEHHDQCRTE